MTRTIGAILAITDNGVLGRDNDLPWPAGAIKGDLPHFKRVTLDTVIIMGANTCASLPGALAGRLNFVVSSRMVDGDKEGVHVYSSIESAIGVATLHKKPIWIIGGASILRQVMKMDLLDEIWITRVHHDYPGDVVLEWSAEYLKGKGYEKRHFESISDGAATKEFWARCA